MSIENFVRAMPKVELFVHFEGALNRDALLTITEQNDIPETLKHFSQWVNLLDKPDYTRLDDLVETISRWLQQPEDLTRLVYELGVSLAKQNVRYAEISIDPVLHLEASDLTFDQFMAAINDGRDRVERGWQVRMAWILTIPRNQPRKADDVLRWATSAAAKKGGVVGIGLSRPEDAQPIGQFERAFKAAEKKGVPRVVHAGDMRGAEGIQAALDHLGPDRILGGWGAGDASEVLERLIEQQTPLVTSVARELCLGRIASYQDYPLRRLVDDGVMLALGSDMPSLYKRSLNDEYQAAIEQGGLTVEDLETVALNAVRASLLPDDEKQTLIEGFTDEYAHLRAEHVTAPTT